MISNWLRHCPNYEVIIGQSRTVKMEKQFVVYILASERNGTLYTGVTSDLIKRGWQHREKVIDGFTKKYGVNLLVYYELHETAESAIHREKRLKKYTRKQKLALIEKDNPEWKNLYETLF